MPAESPIPDDDRDVRHDFPRDQCAARITQALEMIAAKFGEQGLKDRMSVIRTGRQVGLLPDCFMADHPACREIVDKAIEQRKIRFGKLNTDRIKSTG